MKPMNNNLTVRTILAEWLKANGYDGLCNPWAECGCEVDDLMPCGGEGCDGCVAGYRIECPGGECDCGSFHIVKEKL